MVAEAQITAVLAVETPEGRTWRAFATKDDAGWRLYIENDGVPVLAGVYENGKAVAKLARNYMREKFGSHVVPKIDTFDVLIGRDSVSVLPMCFDNPKLCPADRDCALCPYHRRCGLGVRPAELVDPEEPEEVLMARLRVKVAATYGEGSK